jgi:uncharacterized coiled-coil protein SlyX
MIDWSKVEAKKDKEHKIVGTILLDLKAQISNNEKEISSLKETIALQKETISTLNGKLDGMKISLESTVGGKDKDMKGVIEEKNKLQSSLEGKATMLEKKITAFEAKIMEQQGALTEAKAKLAELDAVKKERDEITKNVKILEDELQARDFEYFKKYIKEKSGRASKAFGQKPST